MRYLLDTHVWLWWQAEPERLGSKARRLIEDSGTALLFSAASAWEISIKCKLGKLELKGNPESLLPAELAKDGIVVLPVSLAHALRAGGLPPHNQDPFDRMLIAQAQLDNLTLITADPKFSGYKVHLFNAET